MRTRSIRSVIYFAAGLGLIVSIFTYLETVEASLQSLCSVNSYVSCGVVANSGKTTLFGVPDSYIGIGGFILILIVAAVAESRRRELRWPYLLLFLTTGGVALSFYFGYVEVAEINAICPVCLAAYVFGFITWGATIALLQKVRAKARSQRPETPDETPPPEAAPNPPPAE
ncbi:MAG TPA: vitamin K epoxide reductase family protein [Thermoplasmata archaeon]|nr:vitamin K epoxide reductase family protein [Thermoplasmata archaeon]